MVTISNGREFRHVTNGAYKTIYKSKGYFIVNGKEEKESKSEPVAKKVEEPIISEEVNEHTSLADAIDDGEKEWVIELLEKPISQWSKEETASFAKEKNIDTSYAHKLGEAKDIIKRWMDEHSM